MAITAFLEDSARDAGKGRSARRKLRLPIQGSKATGAELGALVHNISATGLLIESDARLEVGETIEINLPHAGGTWAKVIWTSGRLSGCQFGMPVSQATLSAAQLRSAVVADGGSAEAGPPAVTESLGARLLRLRTERGLTQAAIATQLGVSEPSISAWEQDRARPKAGRLDALAALLDVSTSEILGHDRPATLPELVARARRDIAAAAGTTPDRVRITIEM